MISPGAISIKPIAVAVVTILAALPAASSNDSPLEIFTNHASSPTSGHMQPATDPLATSIDFVGNPTGLWAIELRGESQWPSSRTSISLWSPDDNVSLAVGQPDLVGLNLTTGALWESFLFDPLSSPTAQLRLSVEIDGAGAFALNNDYHIYFYRLDNLTSPGTQLVTGNPVEDLAKAIEQVNGAHPLPHKVDSFYMWGSYGLAVDDMRGRCCNFTAADDPPYSNPSPKSFNASSGDAAPNLPPSVVQPIEVSGVVEAFKLGEVTATRFVGRTLVNATETMVNGTTGSSVSTMAGRYVLITGYIKLREPDTNQERPCSYCSLYMYESDGGSPHDYLGYTTANKNGYFSAYGWVADGEAAIDPYIDVELHASGRISSRDETNFEYHYNPGQAQLLNCSSSTCNMGTIVVHSQSPTGSYGYEHIDRDDWDAGAMAYYFAMAAWDRLADFSYTFNYMLYLESPQTDAQLPDAFYVPAEKRIYLTTAEALAPSTVAHEVGHHVMNDIYGGQWPGGDACPSPHGVNLAHNEDCAWREGFANFWAIHGHWSITRYDQSNNAIAKERYYFSDWSWWNIENYANSASIPFATGGDVEGRVAGTLWDLVDGANDGESVDRATHTHIVPAMQEAPSPQENLPEFYDSWSSQWPTLASELITVAQHNTISTSGW